MTTAHVHHRFATCHGQCAVAARYPEHHDRLLAVDTDADAVLELFEMAVTWHELDYSESEVAGPGDWLTFADEHRWSCAERAQRVFSLAVDIVGRGAVPPATDSGAQLADVIELARGRSGAYRQVSDSR
ncbi:hypothetical protein [Pseudonocardia spinosispora]|uniref:hypothetical protein n=1 Tax=Pseudonocardia spinosispora TaxID=103441 RepID=UPI0012ECB73A|nr:hypothetical protein [Pseudonocardia spinosispora]